uniref:Hint domain-containing protein n=1 Tax=Plectus sambesii TaxID=2011161 RepID=A0A914UHD9_9BILA
MHYGEEFIGGPVLRNGRQVAFNFISNARKLNDGQNRSKYLVVMSRIACLPEPLQLTNDVEDGLENELFPKIEQHNRAAAANPKIHGVDTDIDEDNNIADSLKNDTTMNEKSHTLQPPPIEDADATPTPQHEDPLPTNDESKANNCFTSPSGHRCCSRRVEAMLKEMSSVISSELDENTNSSEVQHRMLNYIHDTTKDRFQASCGKFETIISKGQFAAKSHIISENREVLGCKMQVRIGGDRFRRQADGSAAFVFDVLTYATVVDATDSNSFSIDFSQFPEPLPEQPVFQPGFPASNAVAPPVNSNPLPFVQSNQAPIIQPSNQAPIIQPSNPALPGVQNFANAAAPAGFAGAGAGAGACFSGDAIVETDKGLKRMDELVIGDKVLSADRDTPTFSRVMTFLHRIPERKVAFYEIEAHSGNSTTTVKLTGNHFIYVTDCKSRKHHRIYAADVKIGHCLLLLDDKRALFAPTPVVKLGKVWQTGIYSPLTTTGTIAVNNILASCHSSVSGYHDLHQTFLHWIEVVNSWIVRAAARFNLRLFDDEVFELAKGVEFALSVFDLILPSLSAIS